MALFVSTNPYAQHQILHGMVRVITEHTESSQKLFKDKIEYLDALTNADVVITDFCQRTTQLEFSLCWFEKKDQVGRHKHPLEREQNPFMVGGLVFHSDDHTWGVHT